MKLMVGSTTPSSFAEVISLEALKEMQLRSLGKTLFYCDQLWVISDAEVVPVVDIADVADKNVTFVLTVDLTLVADAENMVHTDCEMCGRVSHLRPDQAELGGVPLDICLRDQQFARVLARLMQKQGIDTDLSSVLRGTVESED